MFPGLFRKVLSILLLNNFFGHPTFFNVDSVHSKKQCSNLIDGYNTENMKNIGSNLETLSYKSCKDSAQKFSETSEG